MNFDMNTISMLMQMMLKSGDSKPPQTPCEQQNARARTSDGKQVEPSAFALQNGIGEQVGLDFSTDGEKHNSTADFINGLSAQNPMLSLLGGMKNGKADIASMLPLVMSLMQKPKKDDCNNAPKSASCAKNESENRDDCKENSTNQTDRADQKETQQGVFSPVAFAGYEVISSLYTLIKASRRPCR